MITPKKLKKGDTVALVAPSGCADETMLERAVRAVEDLGLCPLVTESCRSRHGYFAGSDSMRARDQAVGHTDRLVHGIFALRGGYGAARLLPLLDFEAISRHPKVFCGYSDITALHIAYNQRCGFVTYHAPMPGTELYKADPFTLASFLGNVMEGYTAPDLTFTPRIPGTAKGILTGGNLSLIVSTLGTPYEIDTTDKILFIEEVGEAPYRVDRMLLQLAQAGKLAACRAVILGSFAPETTKSLSQAIEEILVPLQIPLGTDLPCGHCLPTATLPLGAFARIQNDGKLMFQ